MKAVYSLIEKSVKPDAKAPKINGLELEDGTLVTNEDEIDEGVA